MEKIKLMMCANCVQEKLVFLTIKVKRFLPEQALYELYCSLILPYSNYGLLPCGNANK